MNHPITSLTVLLSACLVVVCCTLPQREKLPENTDSTTAETSSTTIAPHFTITSSDMFFLTLDSLFEQMNWCAEKDDEECLIDNSTNIETFILSVSTEELFSEINRRPVNKEAQYGYHVSPDSAVAMFSWDSYLGGSSKDYRNIALYRNERGVNGYVFDNLFPMWCNRIDMIGTNIYVVHGSGTASSYESYVLAKGLLRTASGLELINLFPNEGKNADSALCIYHTVGQEPQFIPEKNGRSILVPEEINDFSISYQRFSFEEARYWQTIPGDIWMKYKSLTLSDFKTSESSGFFHGSDNPTTVESVDLTTSYTFADGLMLQTQPGNDDKSYVLISRTEQKESDLMLSLDGESLFPKGRVNDYLFFSGDGVPETTPFYIYHLGRKEFIYKGYSAGVMIRGETVAMQKKSNNTGEENTCEDLPEDQRGWFDVFEMDYQRVPLIEVYTGKKFCIYVQ
jgi:hypothetical protein